MGRAGADGPGGERERAGRAARAGWWERADRLGERAVGRWAIRSASER